MGQRSFVKYTFLKVDPAWRRLPADERERHKREFAAACENFAQDRFLRAYSTVGTRGDCDLVLWLSSPGLADLHDFHVVLAQSGLMGWADTPYSYLSMTRRSEYSDNGATGALEPLPEPARYLFVYPMWKKREWYRLPAEERRRVMRSHIETGRRYPSVSINTSYSYGLDDQEFVVAFESNEPGDFLDLVHELRGTESSMYTQSETPIFTCMHTSIRRALDALDGAAPIALPEGS